MIVLECLFLTIAPCDAAEPWQLGSQDAATPMMQGIIDLHHDIFFFLILIFVFVSWILVRALWHFHYKKNPIPQRIVHGTTIEILWTIFPSIILMFIAIPSFALLYSMDEVVVDPAITIKAIGHQWYWTYEYSDYNSSDEQSLTFDSYTIPEDDLELGQSRLLEVDNRVVVPEKTHLRIIVTPADVPHSWAVPSLGVKCDAVPGRLNQTSISVQREGVYYGQCSEICGTNHAFMRAPGNIGRLLSPLWLSRTTQGASHPRSKLLQRAAGAVWSRGARQSCEGGQSKIVLFLYKDNRRSQRLGSMISFFDRPVRRSAWLYSYMFRLAGHYGYSGMASQRGGVLLKKISRWEPNINIAEWPTKPRIIARESKDHRISNSPLRGKKRSKGRRSSSSIPQQNDSFHEPAAISSAAK
ncbi:cytochrome c oxidase subunit 2 [Castilleja foliolosa]|uniref:Cytochrome c oxidase subunit 2 n=1 Tax=Castilleja foliolosa TaxID=1961234 RepID=A0ABD3E0B1_9LAMI